MGGFIFICILLFIFMAIGLIEPKKKQAQKNEQKSFTKDEQYIINKKTEELLDATLHDSIAIKNAYSNLVANQFKALEEYIIGGYKLRHLIELEEDKKMLQSYDVRIKQNRNFVLLQEKWQISPTSLSNEQKAYIVSNKDEILSLYQMYQKYVGTFEEIRKLFNNYPHAFVYLTVEYLAVYVLGVNMPIYQINEKGERILHGFGGFCPRKIRTIGALSYSQMISLLKYRYKFEETENYILQQIDYNQVWNNFEEQIIGHNERSKHYKQFLYERGMYNANLISSKQYCLNNIASLDLFIRYKNDAINRQKSEVLDKQQAFLRIKNAVLSWHLKVKGIPYYFFYHYYPTRFTDISSASRNVRGLIYDFKDGKRHGNVVNILSQKLRSTFSEKDFKHLCFVCIPASNVHDNNCRYREFAEDLCSTLGMSNGFEHIKITKEKTKSHLGGTDSAEYYIDGNFFKDKNVILFDDVVTRGHSMQEFKELLEAKGSTIICALSIGRTYSDYYGDHREPHPWTNEY